jgi:hypothetical protein
MKAMLNLISLVLLLVCIVSGGVVKRDSAVMPEPTDDEILTGLHSIILEVAKKANEEFKKAGKPTFEISDELSEWAKQIGQEYKAQNSIDMPKVAECAPRTRRSN